MKRSPLEKIQRRIARNDDSGCWEWTGHVRPDGYGHFSLNRGRSKILAHRLSYEVHIGPIPDGLQIDHLCRNRKCVNPAHLEAVTQAENMRRGQGVCAKNAKKTHCLNGHPFDTANTRVRRLGRGCRACDRERENGRWQRRKAAREKAENSAA